MKGTIVIVEKVGGFQDLVTNEVTFKHGEKIKFFTKKTAKNPEGDFEVVLGIDKSDLNGHTFEYELSDKGNGKIKKAPEDFAKKPYGGGNNFTARNNSTNDSIMLQVCYKANKEAYAKDNADLVWKYTEEDFDKMRSILAKLNN